MPARIRRLLFVLTAALLLCPPALSPAAAGSPTEPPPAWLPGCTTLYGFDGQTALAGNNEDFINPRTFAWFIPASPGRYGRVYFGYDDYIPQGGLNDQGVFFDGLALSYKPMPLTAARPHFSGGDLALQDEILSQSANVQQVIDLTARWNRVAGEWSQLHYGDAAGDSAIIDGDTVLRKQGRFQVGTNFRLIDNPHPPYPDDRYGPLTELLAAAPTYSVELFRQALKLAHGEGAAPTLYSQVYELKTGIIHLYLYHDFEHEVVLNLAEELAKGPHVVPLASLFPQNAALEQWTAAQEAQWQAQVAPRINKSIQPAALGWLSGQYTPQAPAAGGPVKVYLDGDRLYMQAAGQLPFELYPLSQDTVFHPFFNGLDLQLTFERTGDGPASAARGALSFKPYNLDVPYALTRTATVDAVASVGVRPLIPAAAALAVVALAAVLLLRRRAAARRYVS